MDLELPLNKKIILFDGVCNMCNASVNYVIDRDYNDVFRFASLQSDIGIAIQKHIGLNNEELDSIILFIPGEAYYVKSSAALQIIKEFKGLWKLAQVFTIIPSGLRDLVYDFVAKNRYKWYGKRESCRIPTPELKVKFL